MENKIVIKNPIQCMEILNSIIEKTYPEEKVKYASYVSMAYFVKNMNLFKKSDVEKVLNDEKLSFSIAAKLTYELLENAIKTNTTFTVYSKKWFHNVKANQPLLEDYLSLLLTTTDTKQIEDFCNANPILSKNYYKTNLTNNHTFEKYVIGNNPELIKNSKTLSEKDLMELFDKGLLKYDHVVTCFDKFSYENQSMIAQDLISFFLKTKYEELSKEEKKLYLEKFSMNSSFFIRKLEELDKNLLLNFLKQKGTESNGTHPKTILNVLQSIVKYETMKTESRNVPRLLNICLNQYKDILLEDVVQKTGVIEFETKDSYLKYLFQEKNYSILTSLSYFNDFFPKEDQELILAANLNNILEKRIDTKMVSLEFNVKKEIEPIFNFNENLLKLYLIKIKKIDGVDKDFINEIEKIILHHKLQNTLKRKHIEKRIKI